MTKNPDTPPARPTSSYELDWEAVEPQPSTTEARDVLGFTPEDRKALGMTAPRTIDLAPFILGDANQALHEAMTHGASYGKRPPRKN